MVPVRGHVVDTKPSDPQRPGPTGRFQFTLGNLMVMTAAASLLLGMWGWQGERGALAACLAAAVAIAAVGVWRRRVVLVATGILLAGAMLYALYYSAGHTSVVAYMSRRTVTMSVSAVDAATGAPVPWAAVRVLQSDVPLQTATGGTAGKAELSLVVDCTVTRYRSLLVSREERSVNARLIKLEVAAAGYERLSARLSRYLGPKCELRGETLPEVSVELVRKPAEEEAAKPDRREH